MQHADRQRERDKSPTSEYFTFSHFHSPYYPYYIASNSSRRTQDERIEPSNSRKKKNQHLEPADKQLSGETAKIETMVVTAVPSQNEKRKPKPRDDGSLSPSNAKTRQDVQRGNPPSVVV